MELSSMFYTIGYFAIFIMLILAVETHKRKQIMIERDSIEILCISEWGVMWQGADIPRPNSISQNDFIAQFGFSCAHCGASAVNQEKLIHLNKCDSKRLYKMSENEID